MWPVKCQDILIRPRCVNLLLAMGYIDQTTNLSIIADLCYSKYFCMGDLSVSFWSVISLDGMSMYYYEL